MVIIGLLVFSTVTPASAESDIPQGAQQFADSFFLDIVKEHVHAAHAGNFNLNPNSENITFGSLHHRYTLSEEFVKSNIAVETGIISSKEYISVVYQDGKPVNVIGTYENEAGVFALSTFGYGLELAKKLDNLKEDEKILYEAPIDAWYIYNGKSVRPLTASAAMLMNEEKNVKDFQKVIYERYKNEDNNPEMGGGISITGSDESTSSFKSIILYFVIGVLGVAVLVLFFINRRLKNKQM